MLLLDEKNKIQLIISPTAKQKKKSNNSLKKTLFLIYQNLLLTQIVIYN